MATNVIQNVYYDDPHALALDLYPTRGVAKGGVIVIHGGGWFQGDKAKVAGWATQLAAEGYFAIVPNYRLAPQDPYPAPLEDMARLCDWVKRRELPFDFRHIAAVGASAGGNLAVELALKYGMPAVSLSGILTIDDWLDAHQDLAARKGRADANDQAASETVNQSGNDDRFYKWFLTNYLPDRADYTPATPAKHVTSHSGPMYLANSLEEFVPASGVTQLSAALNAHSIPHVTRMLAGSRHGTAYLPDVFDDTLTFIARCFAERSQS